MEARTAGCLGVEAKAGARSIDLLIGTSENGGACKIDGQAGLAASEVIGLKASVAHAQDTYPSRPGPRPLLPAACRHALSRHQAGLNEQRPSRCTSSWAHAQPLAPDIIRPYWQYRQSPVICRSSAQSSAAWHEPPSLECRSDVKTAPSSPKKTDSRKHLPPQINVIAKINSNRVRVRLHRSLPHVNAQRRHGHRRTVSSSVREVLFRSARECLENRGDSNSLKTGGNSHTLRQFTYTENGTVEVAYSFVVFKGI